MYARYRIPGIRFDAVTPAATDGLPRMDVAVFVGFAASGPMHRPVLVEDVAGFAAVFGGTLPLAHDPERGVAATAALAPAVRAFFSQGGRRCWVIRVAWTKPLRAAWGVPTSNTPAASARRVALPGLLALNPNDGARRRRYAPLRPAIAEARSLGSWADGVRARTRAERLAFPLDIVRRNRLRLTFTAPNWLRAGELIELADQDGTIAYLRTSAVSAGMATATPLASFRRLGQMEPLAMGSAEPLGRAARGAGFEVDEEGVARVVFGEGRRPKAATPGSWLRWHDGAREVLVAVDAVAEDVASGRAWRRLLPGIPTGPLLAARLRFALGVENGRSPSDEFVFGLDPAGAVAWARNLPDDRHYADPSETAAARPPLSVDAASPPPIAWLPLGLDDGWSVFADPLPVVRTAIERDGLSRFDPRLFLDPALADLSSAALADEAVRIRDVEGRALLGLHGAFHVSGAGRDTDATLLAVPDAVHPGWARRKVEPLPPAPDPNAAPPANWTEHRGPCAVAAADVDRPDWGRFLDCDTRVLPTPVLTPFNQAQPPGTLVLTWTAATPDAVYTLEEAAEADLSDAQEIWTGTDLQAIVTVPREGVYRYRLTAREGADVSAPSAVAVAVTARAWALKPAAAFDAPEEKVLLTLHQAILRTAAASGEMFAMLSLPRHFRTPAATRHAERLMALATADPAEQRALSFGALYHPWLVTPSGDADAPALIELPPDGAAAGIAAARALARGAWIAPANVGVRDIVALAGPIDDADRQPLGEAGLNLVRRDARGFLVLDAQTLSPEPEWRQINVRRLLILLRRTALERGRRYVFEPNGDVLRRAVERGFTQMLDELFRRGAFAGKGREDSFRLVVNPTSQDRDAGRLVVEIGVAPSQPMRFITVRLVQSGERFSVAEER